MLKLSMALYYLLACTQLWSLVAGSAVGSANPVWQYNSPQYASAQYEKIFGIAHSINNPRQVRLGPFQYQYVDYQQNCKSGGQPVCATNGTDYFNFENDCKLEAANMKMLFEQGTELERVELERCLPQCDSIRCNNGNAPVCAAAEQGPHKDQGVTYANECEAQRRGCITKQKMRILNKGPCKQKSRSKSKARRKHGKKRRLRSTTTTTAPSTLSKKKRKHFRMALKPSSFKTASITTSSTTTSTTPVPMQFHQYRDRSNPGVSVSRAVNAYSVYSLADVGYNYDAIIDSRLSLYVPGIGTVTDTPPSTTTTTTTTQRSKAAIPSGFTLPSTISTTEPKQEFKFFLIPYVTTSTTTTESINQIGFNNKANSSTSTLATLADTITGTTRGTTIGTTIGSTAGTTVATTLSVPQILRNATVLETTTDTKPIPQPTDFKTHLPLSVPI